jgi:hypothetical protein
LLVGGTQRRGAHRRNRGNVDDGAAAVLAHQGRGRLGAQERPGEIDRKHPLPVRIGGFQQRREDRDAGIVDQRIQPAEARAQRLHRLMHRLSVGDIAMQRQRTVRVFKACNRIAQQCVLDIEQGHVPALGEKPFCHRKPDTARSAGHQRDF